MIKIKNMPEERFNNLYSMYYELKGALDCYEGSKVPDIEEIVCWIEGAYEDRPFYWVVRFEDNTYGYIEAGCGYYTGWEIGGECFIHVFNTLDDMFGPLGIPKETVDGDTEVKLTLASMCYERIFDEQVEKELKDG